MLDTTSRQVPTRDARWQKTADAVIAHKNTHGRFPRRAAGDRMERSLGDWLYHARRALAGQGTMLLTSERKAYLSENAPEWFISPRQVVKGTPFAANADRIGRFHELFGYFPQQAKDADSEELRLAWFLNSHRMADRAGKLTEERVQYLDEVAPGWRGTPRRRRR